MVHRTEKFAQGDSSRVVMDLLAEYPQGLTMGQLRTLILERSLMPDLADSDTRALYFRIKRAVESLEELGYVEHGGRKPIEGYSYKIVPVAEKDIQNKLKETLLGMKGRLPTSSDLLLTAFEGVLTESAEELGLGPTLKVGRLAKKIKKKGDK